MSTPRPSTPAEFARWIFPSVLVLAGAIGYIGIDLWVEELPDSVPGDVSPFVHAGLVALQAVILLARRRSPVVVFAGVVATDLVILATTAGELGIGSLAIIFASYTLARQASRRHVLPVLAAGAAATTGVGATAMLLGSSEPLIVLLLTAAARIAVLYALPAVVAEYARGRDRLAQALHDQARMAEQERRDRAEREVRDERTALARELHDIAGHHLSGIIVSAQAASALTRSDPERARAMMRTVQDDARTTLADLRRTVGLLRSDDAGSSGGPSPTPSIDGIAGLVDAARARGQQVSYEVSGAARSLGPLAETAAYRMVQESLANAARHAPDAACRVRVDFMADAVDIAVSNDPAVGPATGDAAAREGYGLSGMAERAALIGARLSTGPAGDGGWSNRLHIPIDTPPAPNDGRGDT